MNSNDFNKASMGVIMFLLLVIGASNFSEVIFYLTKENRHLFDGFNSTKIVLEFVPFSNSAIVVRALWAQLLLPFLLIMTRVDVLFCPGNISPILRFVKKVQWVGTVGPFEPNFISSFGWKQKVILLVKG